MLRCPTCGNQYPAGVEFCPVDQAALQADQTIAGTVAVDPLIGHTLDEKYLLEERLGIGGMGTVYRARHILIDRAVAVKVLNRSFVEDDAARIRFHREAKAAGRLHHPNAVSVTDFGQTSEGHVYIVMELLEGRTLREILTKEAPLETARAVALMLQTAAAVEAAHQAGVIHRDLKPANIFVTQRADVPAIVKVLDFGIAKLAADTLDDEDSSPLTQFGAMIGTPRYMSPEQCDGLELTPASDVYSLGVILYEMLTGVVPFNGSTPLAIAVKHATDEPQPPRDLVASIPEELERLVLQALEKRAEDRPRDATALRQELLKVAEILGLEHSSVTVLPDLEALRGAGVESPSGRLIIDLSRLRESGVFSSGDKELTVIGKGPRVEDRKPQQSAPERPSVSRVNVKLPNPLRKIIIGGLVIVGIVVAAMIYFVSHNERRATLENQNVHPATTQSPSPLVSPTPSNEPTHEPNPSPTVRPSPKVEPEKKKESKVHSVVDKVKRILTKPF